jgi:hypothetical protein
MRTPDNTEPLFIRGHLDEALRARDAQALQEVDRYDGNRLLNTSADDLCAYFFQTFKVNPLALDEAGAYADQEEAQIDVSRDPMRHIRDRSHPFYIPGVRFTLHVPYTGDGNLFHLRPNTCSLNPPYAKVEDSELLLAYSAPQADPAQVKASFDGGLAEVKRHLGWQRSQCEEYNSRLKDNLTQQIARRRQRLLDNQGTAVALGYPLKSRPDVPQTYVAPGVRKKLTVTPPPASAAPYVPEPTLDNAQYEAILHVLNSASLVLERSPSSFRTMGEEDLRQHFLVALNASFEGEATAESFNASGKTDILIRHAGANLFVAECKVWTGEQAFLQAIDQLLGYLTWRDTKAALLVFNRRKDFSAVLGTIQEAVPKHPQYKRRLGDFSESGFRFVLHLPGDPNREVYLTVLAFDVPS